MTKGGHATGYVHAWDQGGMRGLDSSRMEAAWKQSVASAIHPSSL